MLVLGNPKEAADVFDSILEKYGKDEALPERRGGRGRIMWIKLKRATALREMGDVAEADALVEQLLKENPRSIEVRTEKGLLLEDKAAGQQGHLGRRVQPLADPRPATGQRAAQAPRILRRLVSHGAGALQGRQARRGQEDPRQRHAALGHRGLARDQGQVRRRCSSKSSKCVKQTGFSRGIEHHVTAPHVSSHSAELSA